MEMHYVDRDRAMLFTLMISCSYTSESSCIGVYTSYEEAKKKYLIFLKEDYEDAQNNDDMQQYIENDGHETIKEWYNYYREKDDYTMDDGEKYTRVSIEYLSAGDFCSFNPVELLFRLYKDKLSPETVKELEKLNEIEISKSLIKRV